MGVCELAQLGRAGLKAHLGRVTVAGEGRVLKAGGEGKPGGE